MRPIFKTRGLVLGVCAAALLAGSMFSSPAQSAPKVIKLTAIDGYSDKAIWVERFKNYFVPEVNKILAKTGNYKIQWNLSLNGQIVKPRKVLGGLQKGLGDIGVVTHIFHPDKVPLYGVSFNTPFSSIDPMVVTKTIDKLVNKFPKFKGQWKKYNQVTLTNGITLDTYQLFLKHPAKSIADLKGRKIMAGGDNRKFLKAWGATPVGGPLSSYYDKVKTGIAEGAMIWPQAAGAFKFAEVTPYMLDLRIGSMASKAINVNAQVWKKLPAEVKKALQTAALGYRDQMAIHSVKKSKILFKKYLKAGGKVIPVSDADRKKWAMTIGPIAKEWAAAAEKKGLPGNAVLKAYMDELRAAKQPLLRNWDKE
jgi:TRAP-type C4-dicarboxylate transport system substrate-binding protein